VQTGRTLNSLVEDLELLNRALFVRGIFVIALAPLGGWFLARQLTGPIKDIIRTAERMQPQHLNERLPIRGTRDELDRVSQTINRMLDRIADYIDRNRAFVANAAHELRSPLAAIRSSAEVALNRPRTNDEYVNVLTDMVEEVDRLSSMVNRLLLLAETDVGRAVVGPDQVARLDKVVLEAVDMFQAVADVREIRIRVDELASAHVAGDESSLRHIVRNLLDNAIKFSPPGGGVTLSLTTATEPPRAVLIVADRGLGIAPDDLPRVFERFFRGDRSRQRSDERAGSGLGLSICQAIASSLGGTIEVQSELGRGTTFTVALPLVPGELKSIESQTK
jgi:heavy metal sensor kinase